MKPEIKKEHLVFDITVKENLRTFKLESINFVKLIKKSGYTKAEAKRYILGYCEALGQISLNHLFKYWIRKYWRQF